METLNRTSITVQTTVNAPVEKVWNYWNSPEHITQWNTAIDTWHSPYAQNDLCPGGKFSYRMEAKDGSMGFDYAGVYDQVKQHELIELTIGDGRKVIIKFTPQGNTTHIEETFDAENQNPVEMQRAGWQAILDNFRKHTEAN